MWCCADFLQSDNVIASKADTMVETITHIDQDYGGVRGYCKAIGLSDEEIAHIRTNFMKQAITCMCLNPSYCSASSTDGQHDTACVKNHCALRKTLELNVVVLFCQRACRLYIVVAKLQRS